MNPGFHGRVEKLQPGVFLRADVKHHGVAQEQMFEAKAGRHASEVI